MTTFAEYYKDADEPRGCFTLTDDNGTVSDLFLDGSVRETREDVVTTYMGHEDAWHAWSLPVRVNKVEQEWRYEARVPGTSLSWKGSWKGYVRLPTPPRVSIVDWDIDEATYVGDGESGVYYLAQEGPGGWYVTTVVDTNDFCDDLTTSDGPYESYEKALMVGRDMAIEWCGWNDVDYRTDEEKAQDAEEEDLS